ncbi:DUF6777 domain-containing protein [Streptomyces sp. NPDC052225]|uniref:DUF6777 domain-containing protein n=1 Tax=Streptomyces sp. NPDC052225 TaxID=3154949 RepID=UPI0034442885
MRARTRTRTYVTALGISAALLLAGCSGGGDENASDSKGELFLQPVAAQGPDPFTESTATAEESPPPVTRTPQPTPTAPPSAQGEQTYSGETPGLYGGTKSLGSCDVERQIRFLTADQAKASAFAQASGIDAADIPGFLRGLTSVVLRVDTRVTNHGYSDGHATTFQSVLQSGTAVMVDSHGMPRVRCACGNPLKPPVAFKSAPSHQGQPWRGYEPTKVVIVAPSTTVIQNITIINVVNNTWIERPIGDNGHTDRTVPPPTPTPTPTQPSPDPDSSSSSPSPDGSSTSPAPSDSDSDTASPDDATSTACPTATATPTGTPTGTPSPWPSGCPTPTSTQTLPPDAPTSPDTGTDPGTDSPDGTDGTDGTDNPGTEESGPQTVPDSPDQPDGGGLIPDATDDTPSFDEDGPAS